jgi:hypothetical protein
MNVYPLPTIIYIIIISHKYISINIENIATVPSKGLNKLAEHFCFQGEKKERERLMMQTLNI